jgi:CRP/FNR family transcriptional regulator, anaerobic regulatory protein
MTCEHKHHHCLLTVPIFKVLNHAELSEITNITSEASYLKGSYIYQANETHPNFYVLHTGKVKISRINANGKEQVIRVVTRGDFIGELSFLRSEPTKEFAQVIEDVSMCVIDGNRFKEVMQKNPMIAFKIMEVLSERLEHAESIIESTNLESVDYRVAQMLLSLSSDNNTIQLELSKGNLASLLGITQETLSRKLALFAQEGLIELKGHRVIKIKNREKLIDII